MLVPVVTYLQIAKQLLRYLAGTIDVGITYSNRRGELPYSYSIYTDSTWGTEQDRVSFHGYMTIRYEGAVTWMAQRQKSTAQSSMDSEIITANKGTKEAAWLEKVIDDLGEKKRGSNLYIPTLYYNNLKGIDLVKDIKFYNKAKYIKI